MQLLGQDPESAPDWSLHANANGTSSAVLTDKSDSFRLPWHLVPCSVSGGDTMKSLCLNQWIRIASLTLVTLAFCAIWTQAQSQDTQTPDLQQLKDKLQQLDQEMQELKGQIKAAQQAQTPSVANTKTLHAPNDTQSQAQTVPKEVEEKEQKSSIDLYGFVMLDSGYEFRQQDPNWFDVIRPTKLPSFKGEFAPDGNVYASVRQSRFGVKSSTPTRFGALNTLFEFELFGTGVDAGQTTFRLRHAYGELGQFGAGKPGARSWILTSSLTRWSTGDPMGWFSSVPCRCVGCLSEMIEAASPSLSNNLAPALTRVSMRTALS